jgi:large subunit ribosomal protein L19e
MKLENKKDLVARTLGVGKNRIVFNKTRLSTIKEAITKQDIRDLLADGTISIKEIKGRAKVVKRTTRRRAGSIRHKVNEKKQGYVKLTRKLRRYLAQLRMTDKISAEDYQKFRKEIKNKSFKSLSHMKEQLK